MFYLYRKSSGEVISVSENSFDSLNSQYSQLNTQTKAVNWPLYCDGVAVRSATVEEINAFAGKEKLDAAIEAAARCAEQVDDGSRVDIKAILETLSEITRVPLQDVMESFHSKLAPK